MQQDSQPTAPSDPRPGGHSHSNSRARTTDPAAQQRRPGPQPRPQEHANRHGQRAPPLIHLDATTEEATETLLHLAERRGTTIESSGDATPALGSPALLLQLTTNLVHNAIVHNLPEQGTVWVTTSAHPKSVELIVENTGQTLAPQLIATLAEPFERGSKRYTPTTQVPASASQSQKHHASTRRNPHPRAAARRRAPRHGATPRSATARSRMTTERINPARCSELDLALAMHHRAMARANDPPLCRGAGRQAQSPTSVAEGEAGCKAAVS